MRVAVIAAPYPLEEFPSPPLGIAYVAAAFEAAGCEVRIFDYIISCYSGKNWLLNWPIFSRMPWAPVRSR